MRNAISLITPSRPAPLGSIVSIADIRNLLAVFVSRVHRYFKFIQIPDVPINYCKFQGSYVVFCTLNLQRQVNPCLSTG